MSGESRTEDKLEGVEVKIDQAAGQTSPEETRAEVDAANLLVEMETDLSGVKEKREEEETDDNPPTAETWSVPHILDTLSRQGHHKTV